MALQMVKEFPLILTGSQLVAGESENTFAYTLNEGTKAVNHDIHIQLGKLVVDPVSGEFKVVAGNKLTYV